MKTDAVPVRAPVGTGTMLAATLLAAVIAILAVVSDSYDVYHAIREHWGRTLREEVIASGATVFSPCLHARPCPMLTGERRMELSKAAHKYAEGAKVAVRGVRRDGMEQIKALEKKATISKDDEKRWSDEVQKLTDQYVKRIDESLAEKDKEIKQV